MTTLCRTHRPDVRAGALVTRLPAGPVCGVEVGVFRGQMSAEVLRMHAGTFLYMVDAWESCAAQPKHPKGRRVPQDAIIAEAERLTAFASTRRQLLRMRSLEAALTFADGSFDFVFIDAEHTYEAVRADIRAWLPKLKPGALLSGHDYSPPGLYSAKGWPGVVQAVDEVVAANGWSLDLGDNATWFVRLP